MISSTELSQLLRIPLLVEHFIEHNQEGNRISIADFFHMHYLEKDHMDADYDKDMQLPFKSIDGNNLLVMAFIPYGASLIKPKPPLTRSNNFDPYATPFINDAHLSSIWQPPKLV